MSGEKIMYEIGTMLQSKKPHACGGNTWRVVRNGADYKLECTQCGHIVLLDSVTVDKKFRDKTSISR